MKKLGFVLAAAFYLAAVGSSVSAQTIYNWNQTGTASWTTAANWSPTRTTPATNDLLQFNNGGTITVTAVPTETISRLIVSSTTTLNLQAGASGNVLTISQTGERLSVAIFSALNINGANALTLNVATGSRAVISGSMTFTNAAHTFTAADASGITFNSGTGATFTQGTGCTGNVFGNTGTANTVIFNSGSIFDQKAGSNPFGLGQPSSKVLFQPGSLFRITASGVTPEFSGRTYANFELNNAAANITVTGSSAVSINDLTITAGTLNFNMTTTPGHSIKGNISVAGTLIFNPLTAGTVNLNGTSVQTISGAGTLTINAANQTVIINNSNGITLSRDVTFSNGTLTFTSGNITTGSNTLIIGSAGTVTRTSGHVIGNLRKAFAAAANKTFEVGTANGYSPVQVNPTAGTFPADFTIKATQGAHPSVSAGTSIQRFWTLTNTTITSADLTFQYLAGDVMGNEANYKVIRISGGTPVSFPSSTVNTGADTASVTGVTSFSDWTVGESLAPTAANGLISGTITDSQGAPVAGTVVNLSGSQNRKFITDANGNYRFDNVETSGFYTVAPSRANYSFTPSQRSFSQLGSKTEAAFTGSSTGESANPLDTAEYFVRQQYVDLLGREPDEGGFNYWSDRIPECGSDARCVNSRRRDVAAAFFIEQEFQRTGSFIYGLYKGSLSRRPVYTEFSSDRQQVREGPNLEATKQAFAESFVSRAEFTSKYQGKNSTESFVDALLVTVSQSSGIDLSNQRANLVSRYNAGANLVQSRSFVLREVVDNSGFRAAEYNRAFVLAEYFGYLQRDPDEGGYAFWLDVVSNRDVNNYRSMVCAFINSSEYQRRFSSIVSHSDSGCSQ